VSAGLIRARADEPALLQVSALIRSAGSAAGAELRLRLEFSGNAARDVWNHTDSAHEPESAIARELHGPVARIAVTPTKDMRNLRVIQGFYQGRFALFGAPAGCEPSYGFGIQGESRSCLELTCV
jgi:hypothetical protein